MHHQEGRAATECRRPQSGVFRAESNNATASARAIGRAAARIAQVSRRHDIGRACAIGEIVIEEIYLGDLRAFRSRGVKDDSLRKLAAEPELDMSSATLWRAVGVFLLCRRTPGFRNPKHLGLGHLYVVLGLPERLQEELLLRAEVECWSRAQLEENAALHRSERPRRRSRRTLLRHVRPLQRLLSLPLPEISDPIPEDARREIEELLVRLDQWASKLRKRLTRSGSGVSR